MNLQLKAMRKKRKLSQTDLAEKINVNLRTIGAWERGETMMSAEQVWNCAVALDTDPNTLLGWDEGFAAAAPANPEEAELVGAFRSCTDERRGRLLDTARDFAGMSRDVPEPALSQTA